jgi:hypothetical protein
MIGAADQAFTGFAEQSLITAASIIKGICVRDDVLAVPTTRCTVSALASEPKERLSKNSSR